MKNVVTSVMPDSIAEEVGIEVNDILLSINGEKIVDIIDYRFLTADEEIVLEIQKPDGEVWEYEIEKDLDPKYKMLYDDIEDRFQGFFGTKVKLDQGKRKGKIIIEYNGNSDLERILDLLK